MTMNVNKIILFISLISSQCSMGQANYDERYEVAFNRILKSKETVDFKNKLKLSKPCVSIIGQDMVIAPLDSDSIAFGASRTSIENNPFSCLCGILRIKYGFTGSCSRAIGLDSKLATDVSDSLTRVYSGYKFLRKRIQIPERLVDHSDGVVVFFSDIYKNTLLAELRYNCGDERFAMGKSLTFYIVFNSKSEIVELYSGEIHHD